jgi:hypothetical protein
MNLRSVIDLKLKHIAVGQGVLSWRSRGDQEFEGAMRTVIGLTW